MLYAPQAVADAKRDAAFERVDVNLDQKVLVHLGVSDVAAVGGPVKVVNRLDVQRDVDILILGLVNFGDSLCFDID